MLLIDHRVNTIKKLEKVEPKYGVEIDIRDKNNDLIVVHDPFKNGVLLKDYLKFFKHKFIIANIKSERIEDRVIKVFKKFNINNYFFLDSSFPKIIDLTKKKVSQIAIRVSYYEDISTAKKLKNKVKWIWYDTFFGLPKTLEHFILLKKLNYKICIVCPELHKIKLNTKSKNFINLKKSNLLDAVCTKQKFFKKWI